VRFFYLVWWLIIIIAKKKKKKKQHPFVNIVQLHDYLTKDSKRRYIVRMSDAVFGCFLTFGDNDLKHVRKQDVEEMVSNLEVLTREVVQEKGDEMCERFCLEFSLKCFVCPILEKR